MKAIFSIFTAVCVIFSNNFNLENTNNKVEVHDFNFAYDMTTPDVAFDLDESLEEISGLSLTNNSNQLVVNNDEDGKLFFINKTNGTIEKTVDFWKEGDYEGIEMIGDKVYVVKSTGTIYEVGDLSGVTENTKKHKFFLSKDNDVEALGYDAKNNRLLLGCKGKAGEGNEFDRKKAVYGFDLATKTMIEEPIFLFSIEDVCGYLGHCTLEEHTLEILHIQFDPHSEDFNFNPSSLAIHPITGHIYITSSKGKLILVLSPDGKVLHIEKLKKKIHPQPEGLCFEKDGTMWISSEKKKAENAMLYKFNMK